MENKIKWQSTRKYMNLIKCISRELNISEKEANNLYKKHKILVDTEEVSTNIIVRKNMDIEIVFEKELCEYTPMKGNLEIIYEDQNVLVLNKEPRESVYSRDNNEMTLANKVSFYFRECGLNTKIRFLNRLDYSTSGVVMIAKNPYAHAYLQKQIENRSVKKIYIAFVDGILNDSNIQIDSPISRTCDASYRYFVDDNGNHATTLIKESEIKNSYTKLLIEIKTGRTHQIRVHMKSIGHPILGDQLYGNKSKLIDRQALHANIYGIEIPLVGYKEFIAELPEDLQKLY